MEEKILIKSEQYNAKRVVKSLVLIAAGVWLFMFIVLKAKWGNYGFVDLLIEMLLFDSSVAVSLLMDGCLAIIIVGLIIAWWLGSFSVTVTNMRVFGKAAFGKQVDLPIDSISAVSSSMMKGIAVATASGRIVFKFVKNRDEVRDVITQLLMERQQKTTSEATAQKSATDELKEYKELLDSGVITQEEFEAKKKQLLGV